MTEKQHKPKKKASDYGLQPVMFYLKNEEYEQMREYCYKNRIKHSPFIRNAVVEKLQKAEKHR